MKGGWKMDKKGNVNAPRCDTGTRGTRHTEKTAEPRQLHVNLRWLGLGG